MKLAELCKRLPIALSAELDDKNSYNEYFSAAVLVPLIWENDQCSILFEVRSAHLAWQPGEICFPGGRIEEKDESPLATALRETTEEIGLKIEDIQILGKLDEVISPIGVRLYPFVGYIHDTQHLAANSNEVAEVFSVPLDFILTAKPIIGHMERGTRPLADFPFELLPGYSENWQRRKDYQVLFYKYKQYVIWGLTAQVLYNFVKIYKVIQAETIKK